MSNSSISRRSTCQYDTPQRTTSSFEPICLAISVAFCFSICDWTACRKIDSEIKHPPVVELRKSKLQQEGRFMSRPYTHVQGLLPSVLAMKEEGYTYRQIAKQFGLTKEQVEELCSRARRKQRRIEKGYIPQPKGRPRKTPATQEQLQNNRIVELEMKVELLQNFLSECGRM